MINRKIGRGFEIVLFIALMGASMLGAQMLSFSLNKLALIPLEIYLVWYVIKNKEEIRISKFCIPLLIFYFAQFAGSIVGLLNTNFRQQYLTYYDRLSNNLLQVIFFYIPILIFLSSVNEKNRIYLSLKKCIVLVARIHMIWVFVQFIAWYIFDLDFNEFVFQTIFNNFFGELFSSSTVININGSTQLRATGLNREPAAMALVMICGTCFDNKILFKILYFVATILGMSRTGVVVAAVCLLIPCLIWIKRNWHTKITADEISKFFLIFASLVIVGTIMICLIPSLRSQLLNVIERFTNMGQNQDGSERHVLYPIVALYSWFSDLNLFEKFFGVGGRVSGLVLVNSPYVSNIMIFNQTMLTTAWEIECDYAAILLGNGLVGFIGYFFTIVGLLKTKKSNVATLGIAILIYGIMYNAFTATYLQLVCIVLTSAILQNEKVFNENKSMKMNYEFTNNAFSQK